MFRTSMTENTTDRAFSHLVYAGTFEARALYDRQVAEHLALAGTSHSSQPSVQSSPAPRREESVDADGERMGGEIYAGTERARHMLRRQIALHQSYATQSRSAMFQARPTHSESSVDAAPTSTSSSTPAPIRSSIVIGSTPR